MLKKYCRNIQNKTIKSFFLFRIKKSVYKKQGMGSYPKKVIVGVKASAFIAEQWRIDSQNLCLIRVINQMSER